jgi:hypothetical protein
MNQRKLEKIVDQLLERLHKESSREISTAVPTSK